MQVQSLKQRFRRFFRRDDGNIAIEAAIIFPVGFLLVLGTLEMALYFFASSALNNAVKEMAYFSAQECPADEKTSSGFGSPIKCSEKWAETNANPEARAEKLKEILRNYSGGLIKLEADRLCIRVSSVSGGSAADSLGSTNEIMRYDFLYRWDFFTPMIGHFFGDRTQFNASFLVRNGEVSGSADRKFNWNNQCPDFANIP